MSITGLLAWLCLVLLVAVVGVLVVVGALVVLVMIVQCMFVLDIVMVGVVGGVLTCLAIVDRQTDTTVFNPVISPKQRVVRFTSSL